MILEHLNFILKYMTFLLPSAPFFFLSTSLSFFNGLLALKFVFEEIWDVCILVF